MKHALGLDPSAMIDASRRRARRSSPSTRRSQSSTRTLWRRLLSRDARPDAVGRRELRWRLQRRRRRRGRAAGDRPRQLPAHLHAAMQAVGSARAILAASNRDTLGCSFCMHFRQIDLFLFLFLSLFFYLFTSSFTSPLPALPTLPRDEQARAIYLSTCAACCGRQKGDGRVRLLHAPCYA